MKLKYLVAIICIVFFSCKKDKPLITSVKGEVRNKLTNELLSNIPIEIIGCDFGGKCLTVVKTVYTNSNGYYEMVVDKVDGLGQYKIAIGQNDQIPGTPYPYYYPIDSKKENILNFSEKPLKNLQIRFNILRHDKNWLSLSYNNMDMEGYWNNDFFSGSNPIVDFNKTYNVKIQAGRNYRANVGLSNKIAEYIYQDNEFITKYFYVDNVDTTKIEIIVP